MQFTQFFVLSLLTMGAALSASAEVSSLVFSLAKTSDFSVTASNCSYSLENISAGMLAENCSIFEPNAVGFSKDHPFSCQYTAVCDIEVQSKNAKTGLSSITVMPGSKIDVHCQASMEGVLKVGDPYKDKLQACVNKTFEKCATQAFSFTDGDYEKPELKKKIGEALQ